MILILPRGARDKLCRRSFHLNHKARLFSNQSLFYILGKNYFVWGGILLAPEFVYTFPTFITKV